MTNDKAIAINKDVYMPNTYLMAKMNVENFEFDDKSIKKVLLQNSKGLSGKSMQNRQAQSCPKQIYSYCITNMSRK